jgi:hypothetical protein
VEFTSSDTFVVPEGVTRLLVEMWGGGGDGIFSVGGPSGGGGGAYARSVITVNPGATYTVQIGHAVQGVPPQPPVDTAILDGAGSDLIFAGTGGNASFSPDRRPPLSPGAGGQDDSRAMIHHPGNPGSGPNGGPAYQGNSNPPVGNDGEGATPNNSSASSINGHPGYVLLEW